MLKMLLKKLRHGSCGTMKKPQNCSSLHRRAFSPWLLVACAIFLLPISASAQSASQPSEPESIFIDPKWECVPLDQFSMVNEFRQYALFKSNNSNRYAIRSQYSRCPLVFELGGASDVRSDVWIGELVLTLEIGMDLTPMRAFNKMAMEICGSTEGKCYRELEYNAQERGAAILVDIISSRIGAIIYKRTFSY